MSYVWCNYWRIWKSGIGDQMAYVCKVCGFVLDEDELPEDYVCPVCGVPAANFEEQ